MSALQFQNIWFFKHPIYKNYLASKCGQILSLKRKEKKILKFGTKGRGYLFFCLYENNTYKNYLVSRYVFECFKGEIPVDKEVDHIDNDKKNNRISNLQLLTPKENLRKNHLKKKVISFNIETQEEKIFESLKEAAEYYQIHNSTVSKNCQKIIKNTKSKKNGMRYKFKYVD